MASLNRRSLLRRGAAVGAAALLAGCPGDGGDSTTTDGSATTTDGPTGTEPDTTEPEEREPETTASPDLEERAGDFFDLLDGGDFQGAYETFGPAAGRNVAPATLESTWAEIEQEFGEYGGIAETSSQDIEGGTILYVVAEFDAQRARFLTAWAPRGLLSFTLSNYEDGWSEPDYVDRGAFDEREVTLTATDACDLPGRVSLPADADGVPGVVIVHGNGAIGMDATIGPNKPYRDLAWGLASRGVAVLRYDKRTAACDVDLATLTVDEVITDDALVALEHLRGVEGVDPDATAVVGHSIGGSFAPRIADRDGDLAGIASLAGLTREITQAMLDQTRYLIERDDVVTDPESNQLRRTQELVDRIRSLDIEDGEVVHLGGRPYWRTMQEYAPLATAEDLSIPMLFCQGGRDYQVTVEDDLAGWREAVGDREATTIREYPELNHYFMHGTGEPSRIEYFRQTHVDRVVVEDVTDWVTGITSA